MLCASLLSKAPTTTPAKLLQFINPLSYSQTIDEKVNDYDNDEKKFCGICAEKQGNETKKVIAKNGK